MMRRGGGEKVGEEAAEETTSASQLRGVTKRGAAAAGSYAGRLGEWRMGRSNFRVSKRFRRLGSIKWQQPRPAMLREPLHAYLKQPFRDNAGAKLEASRLRFFYELLRLAICCQAAVERW